MASGFFALFDDIAVLMDDVAVMGKITTKKTAGILADDLAVNAEKASGFVSSRELIVLWKIAKGSFLNKVIILPVAFLLSAYFPDAIIYLLLTGGVYLAYEGGEKIYEYLFHKSETKEETKVTKMTEEEAFAYEKQKIKSAIIVDFILSVEIVIIALGTVVGEPILNQIIVVSLVTFLATIGVYGLVALLVRMDDFGFKLLATSTSKFIRKVGYGMVKILPYLIRGLAVIGTFAMILVAGGIFVHNLHFVHDLVHSFPSILGEFIVGLVVGILALLIIKVFLLIKNAIVK
ncbi:DUF808 domain-containing protein [Marinigracilibium pacificum]|uniref:DUF808 domain-containing protein n=1 Tax=Marinigracilibium pacificum TaxID=2729599 RepID=A0A848J0K1_9BACT|nr:DUF808 domain-containing protein [Marinigracilibium pacificum]NMM49191.1 DUF808 domain-containing protein [Marinigracilibium pacificum]